MVLILVDEFNIMKNANNDNTIKCNFIIEIEEVVCENVVRDFFC